MRFHTKFCFKVLWCSGVPDALLQQGLYCTCVRHPVTHEYRYAHIGKVAAERGVPKHLARDNSECSPARHLTTTGGVHQTGHSYHRKPTPANWKWGSWSLASPTNGRTHTSNSQRCKHSECSRRNRRGLDTGKQRRRDFVDSRDGPSHGAAAELTVPSPA